MSVYNVFVTSIIGAVVSLALKGSEYYDAFCQYHFIHVPDHEYFFDDAVGVCSKGENFIVADLSFTHVIVRVLGITVLH